MGTGLVLTVLLTWVLTRRQRQGLPPELGRRLFWRAAGTALFAGAATYFLLMQVVMPVMFLFGVPMGLFRA